MLITIELTEDQVEAVTKFWLQQQRRELNPSTGKEMFVNPYKSIQDLISQTIMATVIKTAMDMFPPEAALADLKIVQDAQERLAARAKPKLVAEDAAEKVKP